MLSGEPNQRNWSLSNQALRLEYQSLTFAYGQSEIEELSSPSSRACFASFVPQSTYYKTIHAIYLSEDAGSPGQAYKLP